MIQVEMALSFNSIEDINELEGTFTIGIFLDVTWQDQYISWNVSECPGVYFAYIPQAWVWIPDITLYNAATNFHNSMTNVPLFANPNYMWQSRPGIISSVCEMNFKDFPFDTQVCTLIFGSFMWDMGIGGLNLSVGESTINEDTFVSTSWKVVDITTERKVELIWGYKYSLVYYDVYLQRYSVYYWSTAILPNLAITIVALLALWIADINSRLGVAITAMLAIIAVMVSTVCILQYIMFVGSISYHIYCYFNSSVVCIINDTSNQGNYMVGRV